MSADLDPARVPGAAERRPDLRGLGREDYEQITDLVFDTVGRPLKSASLFYALYYLVEIEGVREAAFDFKRVRERQSLGFWWYGTFSMAAEFANACGRYFITGKNIADAERRQDVSVSEHAREFLFPDDDVMGPVAEELLLRACNLNAFTTQRNRLGYEDTYDWLGNRLESSRFEPLGPWNEIARDLFQAMPNPGKSPDLLRQNDGTGWGLNFNGPAWVAIGNHLLRRAEVSDTAFVDMSWGIEHNNRAWFDKIDLGVGGLQAPDEAAIGTLMPRTAERAQADARNLVDATILLLDANQEGDMETVLDAAVEYDRDVEGVNLRCLRRQVGV